MSDLFRSGSQGRSYANTSILSSPGDFSLSNVDSQNVYNSVNLNNRELTSKSISRNIISSSSLGISSFASFGGFVSEIENEILRSDSPINIDHSDEININGTRGVWANKLEVLNWKGVLPIEKYSINEDSNPEIITKRVRKQLEYVQQLAIKYLRPPTPPAPGEIVIKQEANTLTQPAPPLVIRQAPPRPSTPKPLVIREAPPKPPAQIGRKIIKISGKKLPPVPRKVVIERLAQLPSKPQSVIVERWLPYKQGKRRVILKRSNQVDSIMIKPRNVVVQWETPEAIVKKEIKYLGIIKANPTEYVSKFGPSLKRQSDLPQFVLDIETPQGLVLAADYKSNSHYELEGDLDALKMVDLESEGLTEYKHYLKRLGIMSLESVPLSYSSPTLVNSSETNVLTTKNSHFITGQKTNEDDVDKIISKLNQRLHNTYEFD